jgi:uroporphyrinogen decarboxylase
MSAALTSRQIVERALRLEPTPRLPVSLLSAGSWTLNRSGLTLEQALAAGPERIAEAIARTNEEVRCDIVWPGSGFHNLALRAVGAQIKFRARGTPDVIGPAVTSPSEFDRLRGAELRDDPGIRALADAARILVASIGDTTVVGTSQWAPFTLGSLAWGAEHVMRAAFKDPPAVHALLERAAELCFAYLEPFLEAGVSLVSLADPTASGDMVSSAQFARYAAPYIARVAGRLRARGVSVLVHICGDTTGRLDQIPGTGANIMSVDYKVDLARARENLGGKIALAGNLNPVAVMQASTPEGVAEACRACIRAAGPQPGYVLMPGCDIPPSVPVENVRAMVAAAHEVSQSEGRT